MAPLSVQKDKSGNKIIPSVVAFNKNGRLIGNDAKLQIEKNQKIRSVFVCLSVLQSSFTGFQSVFYGDFGQISVQNRF